MEKGEGEHVLQTVSLFTSVRRDEEQSGETGSKMGKINKRLVAVV
jgi:hypothetical protein